jgi:outer membrane protein
MNNRLCILGLAAVLLCDGALATDSLTVSAAVESALAHNKGLRASSARRDAADARSREARSGLLPSVKFDAGYRRLSDVDPFAVQLPFMPTPVVISPTVLDNYTLHASLAQPLFTGFKLSSNARAAEFLAQAAQSDRQSDDADVTLVVQSAYWMLFQARATSRFVSENVVRLESYLGDVERLLKAGMATRNDLLRVGVQLANARLAQIDALNDAAVAQMNLNVVMGMEVGREWVLLSSPVLDATSKVPSPGDADSLSHHAMAVRPDLQALNYRVDAARSSVQAAQGNWWPQIFLNGNVYYNRPNARIMPTVDKFKDTWDIGVTLQFDAWNWGATARQVEQAQAVVQQQEAVLDQVKDNVTFEVRRQILAIKRAASKVDVGQLAVEQAEENSRTLEEKSRTGLATSTEVLDAEVALLQARTAHTGARVEHMIARARLARALGATE